jgi:large subunit ribosomal protein L22
MKKVVASAIANATNNLKQDAEDLVIKEIKVSKAFTIKRFIPGSRGRARPILKRASHVHVELEARPRVKKASVEKQTTTTVKAGKEKKPTTAKKTTKTTKK